LSALESNQRVAMAVKRDLAGILPPALFALIGG